MGLAQSMTSNHVRRAHRAALRGMFDVPRECLFRARATVNAYTVPFRVRCMVLLYILPFLFLFSSVTLMPIDFNGSSFQAAEQQVCDTAFFLFSAFFDLYPTFKTFSHKKGIS